MKLLVQLPILLLGFISLNSVTFAANETINNIRVTGDDDYLNILWDAASSDIIDSSDGYAIQWSDRESDVRIDKPANLYEGLSAGKSLRRSTFENDRFYYSRVYTYTEAGRYKRELGGGSKVLKWKINYRNEVESSLIDANDPVIVKTVVSNDGKTSTAEFGILRSSKYDTFIDFSWSRPKGMTSSDYDGFMIVLSKKSDMSDPVAKLTTDRTKWALRVTDLSPSTQYYAQAYFYEEQGGSNTTFGESSVKAIKTIAAVPRDGSSVKSRNLMKIEKRGIYKLSANDSNTTTATTTTVTVDESDDQAVKSRIAAIKRQISSLQSELNRLEDKIGVTRTKASTSTTTRSTSTTSSTKQLSVRERLKAMLAKKRASK